VRASSAVKDRLARPSGVGIERVTGTAAGRDGTFLLQDQGTVEGSVVNGDWFVVPEDLISGCRP
jgi:hypothetical protein